MIIKIEDARTSILGKSSKLTINKQYKARQYSQRGHQRARGLYLHRKSYPPHLLEIIFFPFNEMPLHVQEYICFAKQ